MCCCQNTPLQTQYNLLCTFSVHNITVTHNVLLSEHTVTVTVKFVMYIHCAQQYCNTRCVAVRTHRYRQSQYNVLCTFSVYNSTVTHNVLLSEHTVTHRHSTIIHMFISWQLYIVILSVACHYNSLFSPAVINQLLFPISCIIVEFSFSFHETCKFADFVFWLHY